MQKGKYNSSTGKQQVETDSSGGGLVEYNATPPTATDGSTGTPQGDINRNTKIVEQYAPQAENNTAKVIHIQDKPPVGDFSSFGWTILTGFTGTTYQTTKATAGLIKRIFVSNTNAAIRYLLIYNQTTATPSGSTNLLYAIPIPIGAGSTIPLEKLELGIYCSTGITLAISTSDTTFTAATAAEHKLISFTA